jgi:7-cyano-7-deazaguanine synthase in queuosine biosynthesis
LGIFSEESRGSLGQIVVELPVQLRGDGLSKPLYLLPGENLVTGASSLSAQLKTALTTLEDDVLTLASAIFAADLAVKRGEREQITRSIELIVPVVNLVEFTSRLEELVDILYFLSNDNWTIRFVQKRGAAEGPINWPERSGKTLLFSGGLDSFAAAVNELSQDEPLLLTSHHTANLVTKNSQEALFTHLSKTFPKKVSRISVRIGGRKAGTQPFPSDNEREATQRTRSFLFLSIAAICARRTGFRRLILMGENGQMAINLPLTPARIGAFSTHTAHPQFVDGMCIFLSGLLRTRFSISNPFLYRTKGECAVILTASRRHKKAIAASVSCWRSSRQAYSHCGECVPCYIRRIALEAHNVIIPEYEKDPFNQGVASLPEDDVAKRNLTELAEFIALFAPSYSDAAVEDNFPGLINDHVDKQQAIAMYRRFSIEARTVLGRYPLLRPLLQ